MPIRIASAGRDAPPKTGDAFTFVTGEDRGLAQSLERVLGKKLHYQNVDGLTMSMPVDDRVPVRSSWRKGAKPNKNRKKFSPKARANSRPGQRSFSSSNRSQWAH